MLAINMNIVCTYGERCSVDPEKLRNELPITLKRSVGLCRFLATCEIGLFATKGQRNEKKLLSLRSTNHYHTLAPLDASKDDDECKA